MAANFHISERNLKRRGPGAASSSSISSPKTRSTKKSSCPVVSSHPKDILPSDKPIPTAKNDIPSTVETFVPYAGYDIQPTVQRIENYFRSRVNCLFHQQSPAVKVGQCLPGFLGLVTMLSAEGDQRVKNLALARLNVFHLSQDMKDDLSQMLDLVQIRGKLNFIRLNPYHAEVTRNIIEIRRLIEEEHVKATKKHN